MARPIKEAEEKRSEVVLLRLTVAERLHVRHQAETAGLSVSEFLRRRALGLSVQPPTARADAALVCEINRIGVNVNQIARSLNADRTFISDWRDIADELRRVLGKVAKAYGS